MPLYTYGCTSCNTTVERRQSFSEPPLVECPDCGSESLRRILHPVGIIFKGSGWYCTDNRSSKSSCGDSKSKGESSTESKTESKSESKAESKAECKSECKAECKSDAA